MKVTLSNEHTLSPKQLADALADDMLEEFAAV